MGRIRGRPGCQQRKAICFIFQYIKSHRTHESETTIIRVEDLMIKKDANIQRTQHAKYATAPTQLRPEPGTSSASGFGNLKFVATSIKM